MRFRDTLFALKNGKVYHLISVDPLSNLQIYTIIYHVPLMEKDLEQVKQYGIRRVGPSLIGRDTYVT